MSVWSWVRLTWRNIDSKLSCCPNAARSILSAKIIRKCCLVSLANAYSPSPIQATTRNLWRHPHLAWLDSRPWWPSCGDMLWKTIFGPQENNSKWRNTSKIDWYTNSSKSLPIISKKCKDGSALKNGPNKGEEKEQQLSHFPDVLEVNPKQNRKPGKATKFREVLSSCQTKTNISAMKKIENHSWKLKVQRNCGQFWHPQFRCKTVCLSLRKKILAAPNREFLNLGFPHQRVNVVVRSLVSLGKSAQFEVQDSRHQLGFT